MKTEDTEALGRQRAKPSKIKARYSQLTCRTARIFMHRYNSTQYCNTETVFLNIPLPSDQRHISDVAKWRTQMYKLFVLAGINETSIFHHMTT